MNSTHSAVNADLIGSFEITVEDHVVTEATPLDGSAETMLRLSGLDHVPTLADLVEVLASPGKQEPPGPTLRMTRPMATP
jgi:hypothetical protein